MNKMKFICYMAAACIGGGFISCQSEDPWDGQTRSGFVVSLADAGVEATTRQTPEDLRKDLKQDAFTLSIVRQATGEARYEGPYKADPISVPAGVYTLSAHYGDDPVLDLDAPYFTGKVENVTLNGNEVKQVSIPCQVGNALLSVKYENTDKIENHYSAYGVAVEVGEESVEIDHTSNKSAYFKAGSSVKLYFKGTWKESGEEKSMELATKLLPKTFAAGDHAIVTLRISPDMTIEITKVDVTEATIDATIPGEWLPKPKVEAVGFTEQRLDMYETETPTARFNFQLSSALQELVFTLTFGDETYQTLNKTYTLSTLTKEERTALTEAGIVLPEIGATEASLDFTALAAKLTGKQGETVENVITLDKVQANDRVLEGEQTYTIRTSAPEFGLQIYPGNTWTKQLTANTEITHGNSDIIRKGMTYQYSTDGSQWSTSQDSLITNLTPGTTYMVKGVFRKYETEAVEMKTYEALSIPNSSLDEGYETSYPKSDNPLYTFNGGWIDTRNELTCHGDGVNAFYVSKSSTLPIQDNNSTVAHMMTIGWGAGNTCNFGSKGGSVINNISAGIVCVGDYDAGSDAVTPKAAYIRPTSLSFTYKASPYNGDEYLVEATLLNISDDVETVVGEGKLQSGNAVGSYQTGKLEISYQESAKELPISHVRVIFKAGTQEDRDHLEDDFRDASLLEGYTNAYLIGSQFWLDSFSFNYDK